MAREYFPKYSEITRDVYDQVKGVLRGYDRLKKKRLDLLYASCYQITGMPHSGGTGDKTGRKAVELAYIDERLDAIGQAAELMRGERGHRVELDFDPVKAFWSYDYFNCQHKRTAGKPNGPCRRTWNNYKYRFAAVLAEKLKIF